MSWNEDDYVNYPPPAPAIVETPRDPPQLGTNPMHDLADIEAGDPESPPPRIGRPFLTEQEIADNTKFVNMALMSTNPQSRLNSSETIPRVDMWRERTDKIGDASLHNMRSIYDNSLEFKAVMDAKWEGIVEGFVSSVDEPLKVKGVEEDLEEEVVTVAKQFLQEAYNNVVNSQITSLTIKQECPWFGHGFKTFLVFGYLVLSVVGLIANVSSVFSTALEAIRNAVFYLAVMYFPVVLAIYVKRRSGSLSLLLRNEEFVAFYVVISAFCILLIAVGIVSNVGIEVSGGDTEFTLDYFAPVIIKYTSDVLAVLSIVIVNRETGLFSSMFGRTDGSKFAKLLQGGKADVNTSGKIRGKMLTMNPPDEVVEKYVRTMSQALRDREFWDSLKSTDTDKILLSLNALSFGRIKKLADVDRKIFLPLFKSIVVGEMSRWFDHHTKAFGGKSKAYAKGTPAFKNVAMYGRTAYWESIKLHFAMYDLLNLCFDDNWNPDSKVKQHDAAGYISDVSDYFQALSVKHELDAHKGCPPFVRDLEKVLGIDAFKITYRVKSVESIRGKSAKTPKPIDDVFALTMVVDDKIYNSVVLGLFNAFLTNTDAPYLCGYRVKVSSKFEKDGKTPKYRDVKVHFMIGDEETGEPRRFGAGYHACIEVKLLSGIQEASIVNGKFHEMYEEKRGYGK
jgi:hypothetical protein